MSYNREELFNLPVEEKYELVMDLWENIDEEFLGKLMSKQGFEDEIDKRVDEMIKHPETKVSWEEVKAKMISGE